MVDKITESLQEKLDFLTEELILATDADIKFKLKHDIKEIERKLAARRELETVTRTKIALTYDSKAPLSILQTWAKARYRDKLILQNNVLRFINNYVSQANDPKPFVGRAAALQQLNDWLTDKTRPFLLLSGEAGRGKSALMLHWLAQVIGNDTHTVIFVPISIRFATNDELTGLQLFFSALSDIFGELKEQLPQKPETSDYCGLILNGFKLIENTADKAFLIVIDGIDEVINHWFTGDNCPIPASFPTNLHLLISARHKPNEKTGLSWLTDLNQGCDERQLLELSTLEKTAMAEAVIQLGRPLDQLAERHAFVEALFHLTDKGDPLLLTLWLGQIWANREDIPHYSIEQLQQLNPSFAGFYEQWQKEQQTLWKKQNLSIHPEDFQQILTLFAIAYAPLKLAELWEIQKYIDSHNEWDYKTLRTILESAHRLVIGDTEQGYTLLHPRLADYFIAKSKNNPQQLRKTRQAFIQWGQQVIADLNQEKLKLDECPPYLLQHYLSHLQATEPVINQQDHLENYYLPLLQKNWALAWENYEEGTWHGYLNDLNNILNIFQLYNSACKNNKRYLATEIRCTLLSATIHTLNNNLPVELVVELAKANIWSFQKAGLIALQYTELQKQINCLLALAPLSPAKEAIYFRQQALEIAKAIQDERSRSYALSAVAAQLQGEEKQQALSQALQAAQAIQDEWARSNVLQTIVPHLQNLPDLQKQSLNLASTLSDKNYILISTELTRLYPALLTYELWKDWINRAPKKRSELLACIPNLTQAVVQLTGDYQQAVEIAQAVIDVGEWWA